MYRKPVATFTITGTIDGIRQVLTWTDGAVTGDEFAVEDVQRLAGLDAITVGIPGVWGGPPALDTHEAALATALAVFDPGSDYSGDPLADDLPADAVA